MGIVKNKAIEITVISIKYFKKKINLNNLEYLLCIVLKNLFNIFFIIITSI